MGTFNKKIDLRIGKLRLRDGDILAIEYPDTLSQQERADLQDHLARSKDRLKVNIICYPSSLKLKVIKNEKKLKENP